MPYHNMKMLIKVWGCRGSLTTAGRDVIRYGGNTTCVEVRLDDGTLVIIDSGSGIHRLGNCLLKEKGLTEIYLLLTHSHWDHVTGFPFFTPAYLPAYTIRVKSGPDANTSLRKYLEHQMDPPYFPVEFNVLRASFDFATHDERPMSIGSAQVDPIPLKHPNGAYGFILRDRSRTFAFMTDNELGGPQPGGLRDEDYAEAIRGADLLFHDAQYNDREYNIRTKGWGHSTYTRAAELAAAAGVKMFGTFHHDPDHGDREIDRSVRLCRKVIREKGARTRCFGVAEGMEIRI
jgi:phosphoribosyl 1,2-cyclic phosphodiesterase